MTELSNSLMSFYSNNATGALSGWDGVAQML